MNIDWSKAPAEYPVWIQDITGEKLDGSGWHREECDDEGGRWTDADGKFWPKNCEARGKIIVHRRPSAEWAGTGLPPVGTVCEVEAFHIGRGNWTKVEILAHAKHDEHDALLVCEFNRGDRADMHGVIYREHIFRPIRTQEQIEAEERENATIDLYLTINFNDRKVDWDNLGSGRKDSYRRAYDAGFRKQPKEDA